VCPYSSIGRSGWFDAPIWKRKKREEEEKKT
jgi:hypothetical protein